MTKKKTTRKTTGKSPQKKKTSRKTEENSELKQWIAIIVLLAVTLVAYLKLGVLGVFLNRLCRFLFGKLYPVILSAVAIQIILTMINRKNGNTSSKNPMAIVFIVLGIMLLCAYMDTDPALKGKDILMEYIANAGSFVTSEPTIPEAGGVIGAAMYALTSTLIDKIGTVIVIAVLFIVAALLLVSLDVYKQSFLTIWKYLSTTEEYDDDDDEEEDEEDDYYEAEEIYDSRPFEPEMIEPVKELPVVKNQPKIRMIEADYEKGPEQVEPFAEPEDSSDYKEDYFDSYTDPEREIRFGQEDNPPVSKNSRMSLCADDGTAEIDYISHWQDEIASLEEDKIEEDREEKISKTSFFTVDDLFDNAVRPADSEEDPSQYVKEPAAKPAAEPVSPAAKREDQKPKVWAPPVPGVPSSEMPYPYQYQSQYRSAPQYPSQPQNQEIPEFTLDELLNPQSQYPSQPPYPLNTQIPPQPQGQYPQYQTQAPYPPQTPYQDAYSKEAPYPSEVQQPAQPQYPWHDMYVRPQGQGLMAQNQSQPQTQNQSLPQKETMVPPQSVPQQPVPEASEYIPQHSSSYIPQRARKRPEMTDPLTQTAPAQPQAVVSQPQPQTIVSQPQLQPQPQAVVSQPQPVIPQPQPVITPQPVIQPAAPQPQTTASVPAEPEIKGPTFEQENPYLEQQNEPDPAPAAPVDTTPVKPARMQDRPYRLPKLSLLDPVPPKPKDDVNAAAAAEKGELLVQALRNFDIESRLIDTHIGPSVTKFEIRPDANVKVSRISGLADDIKMQLAVRDVRIEAPIPGHNAVGVEIPNQKATPVKMKELFNSLPDSDSDQPLLIVLGKDLMGNVVTCRLDKMPHMLIAGATGSGKSVCMNSIITSILLRTRPDEVKLLLVDPKKVEFTPYQKIPHLIGPVINDPTQANNALKVIVKIMDERYDVFSKAGVRNIQGFNSMVAKMGPTQPDGSPTPKKMPYIVVIVDEMADLMNVAGKEVEGSIQRITQLARAAGIHLIVATQRPSTDVITGVIKSNIPSRIAFAVSSGIDSRTILDHVGAERLLGNGDMLFVPIGTSSPLRVQGVFITDDEVKRITDYVSSEAVPMYDDAFIRLEGVNDGEGGIGGVASAAEDPMFDEIREYVIEVQKASTSLLQRRFGIGYNRAARMIDLLEEKGIIGPAQGSKPREVYMKKNEDA